TLVSGPTSLTAPAGATVEMVRSASDMHAAVVRASADADVVIMAAAVADYRPADGALSGKRTKSEDDWELRLVRTRDILADLGAARTGARPVLVGFAAETGEPVTAARRKLSSKRVYLFVANDVSTAGSGFDVETYDVSLGAGDRADAL